MLQNLDLYYPNSGAPETIGATPNTQQFTLLGHIKTGTLMASTHVHPNIEADYGIIQPQVLHVRSIKLIKHLFKCVSPQL